MGKRKEGMSVGVREIRKVLEMASSWPGGSYLLSLKTEEREKAKREKEIEEKDKLSSRAIFVIKNAKVLPLLFLSSPTV